MYLMVSILSSKKVDVAKNSNSALQHNTEQNHCYFKYSLKLTSVSLLINEEGPEIFIFSPPSDGRNR